MMELAFFATIVGLISLAVTAAVSVVVARRLLTGIPGSHCRLGTERPVDAAQCLFTQDIVLEARLLMSVIIPAEVAGNVGPLPSEAAKQPLRFDYDGTRQDAEYSTWDRDEPGLVVDLGEGSDQIVSLTTTDSDPEALSSLHEEQDRIRGDLLDACLGDEDTLDLMMRMANGETSSREIAAHTGKNHTTIWRWYRHMLETMAVNLVAAGYPARAAQGQSESVGGP